MSTTALLLGAAALLLVPLAWFLWSRTVRVRCRMDLESTHEHLHAHVSLEGFEVGPGDSVEVRGAPARLAFGERREMEAEAIVRRASWPRRQWIRLAGRFEFYELYDVGFE